MAMMDVPLNAWLLFGHAARHFADTEVVTRGEPGDIHRYTYADFARRAQQLMHALDRLGVAEGERVATLGWAVFGYLATRRFLLAFRPEGNAGPPLGKGMITAQAAFIWLGPFLGWWTMSARVSSSSRPISTLAIPCLACMRRFRAADRISSTISSLRSRSATFRLPSAIPRA